MKEKNGPLTKGMLLAEPEIISAKAQLSIVRYTEALYRAQLTKTERAELLFQRGVAYDAVGLLSLARVDYAQALALNPALADAYNSMGVVYIQAGMYTRAYEAFDSALELNADYDFALLNRGIALYYGGRSELAINDTQQYLDKDPTDPYRLLWHYFIYTDTHTDIESQNMLRGAREALDTDNWATSIIDFYLGDISESGVIATLIGDVTSQTQLNYRLCEAYFYLGKHNELIGNSVKAQNYFKLSLATNVYEYVEHKYARIELSNSKAARLEQMQNQQAL